jgi:hypothetical protein
MDLLRKILDRVGLTAGRFFTLPLRLVTTFAFLAIVPDVSADERLAVLKVDIDTYTNVTVTSVTATDIYFTCDKGMLNAKLKNLEPAVQKHFGFDPEKARHAEINQAQADAAFRAAAARTAPANPANNASSEPGSAGPATNLVWGTDLPRALERAKSENKSVLLLFDGSDWCPTSMQVAHDILNKSEFMTYARDRFVLVLVDFPHRLPQSERLKEANENLAARFNIHYYPTFILLDSNGENLGGVIGYTRGGPSAFVAKLEHYRTR